MTIDALKQLQLTRSAVISTCGQYRYRLERRWFDGPVATFIMLNPSTANAEIDDATIRKCMGFASRWGMGGIVVGNLFAFRATDPKHMKAANDPIGPDNDMHLEEMSLEAKSGVIMQAGGVTTAMKYGKVVCAWGANGSHYARDRDVLRRLREWDVTPLALRITSKGAPEHPLYVPYDVTPIEYKGATE